MQHKVMRMIEPALSILVDGDSVLEAAVVYSDGRIYCYPCVNGGIEYLRDLSDFIFKLVKLGVINLRRDYVILYLENYNLVIIPLNEYNFLVLSTNPKYITRRLVRGFLKSLRRLFEMTRGIPPRVSEGEELEVLRRKPHREERVVVDLAEELPTDEIKRLKTDFRVVKEVVNFHRRAFSKLKYRKVEISVGENTLHVIPLGEAHLALTELQDCSVGDGAVVSSNST